MAKSNLKKVIISENTKKVEMEVLAEYLFAGNTYLLGKVSNRKYVTHISFNRIVEVLEMT